MSHTPSRKMYALRGAPRPELRHVAHPQPQNICATRCTEPRAMPSSTCSTSHFFCQATHQPTAIRQPVSRRKCYICYIRFCVLQHRIARLAPTAPRATGLSPTASRESQHSRTCSNSSASLFRRAINCLTVPYYTKKPSSTAGQRSRICPVLSFVFALISHFFLPLCLF